MVWELILSFQFACDVVVLRYKCAGVMPKCTWRCSFSGDCSGFLADDNHKFSTKLQQNRLEQLYNIGLGHNGRLNRWGCDGDILGTGRC
jgi:hypothetical protein